MVTYLLRYAEIGLKGKNRAFFESLLIKNVKKLNKNLKVKKTEGRLIVESDKKINFKQIFGLASYSPAIKTKPDIDSIAEIAISFKKRLGKFRVSCQRVDKNIALRSIFVEKEVGALLMKYGTVSLKDFDTEICVELVDGAAFVFIDKINCFGGLPVGSQSRVAVLLQSAKDVLAGLFALKRGCSLLPVCHGFDDTKLLERFGADKSVKLKDLKDLDQVLKKNNCLLLYSGQCIKDLFDFKTSIPIVRPLIFHSDKEIDKEFQQYKSSAAG